MRGIDWLFAGVMGAFALKLITARAGRVTPTAAKAGRWFRSRIFAKSRISGTRKSASLNDPMRQHLGSLT